MQLSWHSKYVIAEQGCEAGMFCLPVRFAFDCVYSCLSKKKGKGLETWFTNVIIIDFIHMELLLALCNFANNLS